ncbi:hypothetical protein E2562_039042 [Oryza meyeriana var. granulata]|uniref:Uncharacterized protein n=1 Tax=Oryza meyeriana var. granulata TaxID=110450 RepID=A0A6G1CD38_9ORYZ|nr:hypothetical protein E2562_039042 [Oryza meyeriana var. granulata]
MESIKVDDAEEKKERIELFEATLKVSELVQITREKIDIQQSAAVKEKDLREEHDQLRDEKFSMIGSLRVRKHTILNQTEQLNRLKKVKDLEAAKAKVEMNFEEYKIKTRAQFVSFTEQVHHAKAMNQDLVDAAKLVLEIFSRIVQAQARVSPFNCSHSLRLLLQP